jgi:hypothetical protein
VIAGRSLTEALNRLWQAQPRLAGGQRGAVQDLAYAALRRFGRDDFYLARLMEKPPAAPVRALLLVALARLAARPEEAHTIVDQAVEAAGALARGRSRRSSMACCAISCAAAPSWKPPPSRTKRRAGSTRAGGSGACAAPGRRTGRASSRPATAARR